MQERSQGQSDRELGELFGCALSMLQERIGIVIGGMLFISFVPFVGLVPVLIAVFSSDLIKSQPEHLTPAMMAPLAGQVACGILLFCLIYYSLRVGWQVICLKISKGEEASFSQFFSNFSFLLNFLGVNFLVGLVVAAGSILLIVPGVYLGIRFAFAPLLVIDRGLGPIEAMKSSWEMVEGQAMKVFLAGFAVLVLNIVVSLVPLLGSIAQIFVSAYYDLLICTLYRNKKGDLVVP